MSNSYYYVVSPNIRNGTEPWMFTSAVYSGDWIT